MNNAVAAQQVRVTRSSRRPKLDPQPQAPRPNVIIPLSMLEKLKPAEIAVWAARRSYGWRSHGGYCRASIPKLASRAGISRWTVMRIDKVLRRLGYMTPHERGWIIHDTPTALKPFNLDTSTVVRLVAICYETVAPEVANCQLRLVANCYVK